MYIKYTFSSLTVQIYIHSASNIHSHQIYIYIYIYIKMYINIHQYTSIFNDNQNVHQIPLTIYYIGLNVEVMTSSEGG